MMPEQQSLVLYIVVGSPIAELHSVRVKLGAKMIIHYLRSSVWSMKDVVGNVSGKTSVSEQ